jgi:hypothetical protein
MRPTTRAALILLPVLVLAGATVSTLRLQHGISPLLALRHPVPIAILFPGSVRAWEAGVVFTVLAIASVGYALIVHDAPAIPRRWLVGSGATSVLFALGWPLVYSADIYSYAAYGVEMLRGIDPYAAAVVTAVRVPTLIEPVRAWGGSIPRDVGGPLFTALCGIAAWLREPVSVLRIVAVAAYVACIRFWPEDDPRGAAFFGAHPVVVWSAAEGHNDVLAFAFVVLAWRTGGRIGWVFRFAAAITKAFAVIPLALALAHVHRRRAGYTIAAAILIVAYLPVFAGLPHDIAGGGPKELRFSALGLATLGTAPTSLRILGAALAIGIVVCCFIRRRDGVSALVLAAWAVFPTPYPWWAIWLVAVIARNRPSPSWAALIAVTFGSVATYLPEIRYGMHIPATAGEEISFAAAVLAVIYLIPLLVVATAQIRDRRSTRRVPFATFVLE